MDEEASCAEIFAVDVGATSIKAARVRRDGTLASKIYTQRTRPPIRPEQVVAAIEQLGNRCGATFGSVVGFPGSFDAGRVTSPDNLVRIGGPGSPQEAAAVRAWEGFDLRGAVSKLLGVPVVVANDADVAAVGSAEGNGRELTVTLGSGVGTGFVCDGVLQDHVEYPRLKCFADGEVDAMVGEEARKKLDPNEWEQRVRKMLKELIINFETERCFLAGGNARRLRRDDLQAFGVPVWVVDKPVGLLGASGFADQL